MRVLVACEFSGIVRDAFAARGHDAWSCDLEPTERLGKHLQTDVLTILDQGWDLMIAHPPCTYLSRAGAHLWPQRQAEQTAALNFVRALWETPIPRVALENPVGALNRLWRYPDQMIQPWQHGHPWTKKTCLWLRGLPPLMCSYVVAPTPGPCWSDRHGESASRKRNRSRTFTGIAEAMATQWG
jgi:site-specific DNA-cytosine methylase